MPTSKSNPIGEGRTRRAFMKETATISAGISAAGMGAQSVLKAQKAPYAGKVLGANDRIVVGFIGTGSQGQAHVRYQSRHAGENNISTAAVCDIYQKRLKEAQSILKLPDSDTYTDHRKLLERKDIDAVTISTVDNWHAPISIDAMEAGKHVYCEKPMTRYFQEALGVYDTCKKTGKTFQLGSQFCSDKKYHQAAKWVKEGLAGPLVWMQASYCRNNYPKSEWTYPIDPEANESNLDWKRWLGGAPKIPFNPDHYFSWHKYYAYNNGILGNLLPHRVTPLMMVNPVLEFPKRVVCTGTRAISLDREITDSTHLLAEFPSGLTLFVAGSTVNEKGVSDMVRGLKSTMNFASSQNKVELRPERPFTDELDPEDFAVGERVGDVPAHEKNWFDCIRSGKQPHGNIELAVRSHAVIAMAEISERLSLTVLFDEKTRKLTDGYGKEIEPISYDTNAPVRTPVPMS
jgi:predicted dehydrogenase